MKHIILICLALLGFLSPLSPETNAPQLNYRGEFTGAMYIDGERVVIKGYYWTSDEFEREGK